jgi:O-antigen ligase
LPISFADLALRAYLVLFVIVGYLLPSHSMNTIVHVIQEIWWSIAFVVAAVGLYPMRSVVRERIRASAPLLVVLVLAVVSTLWSDDPPSTLRRAIELAGSGVLSLYCVLRVGTRAFLETLGVGIVMLSLMSVAFVILLPEHGIVAGEYGDDAWKGCFNHKNGLGQAMILGIITVGCAMKGTRGVGRWLHVAALVIFAVLLVNSRSGTSIAIGAALAIAAPIGLWIRRTRSRDLALALGLGMLLTVAGGLLSDSGRDAVFSALGKDETLTGRTGLWRLTVDAIEERPVLGYGYKAFWLTDGGGGDQIRREETWEPTQAHNGFLEVALDIGILGLACVGVFLVHGLVRATQYFWRGDDLWSAWPLLALCAFILTNLAEATMVKFFEVPWVVFVAAYVIVVGHEQIAAAEQRRSDLLAAAAGSPAGG